MCDVIEYSMVTSYIEGGVNSVNSHKPCLFAGGRSHLRKTSAKKDLKAETLDYFHKSKIWQMENEFYLFANKTFTDVLKKTFVRYRGKYMPAKRRFFFEKIRPRPKESL
jgi:heparan sulfate 2-O-sulfotransferase HS2ST1